MSVATSRDLDVDVVAWALALLGAGIVGWNLAVLGVLLP